MVIADFSGQFTNPDNCRENEQGVVLTEGSYEEKKTFAGIPYKQLSIDVEVNGKSLVHSLGMNEGKKLVAVWGKETQNWIGKKFLCHIVRYMAQGQTKQKIEIEPLM